MILLPRARWDRVDARRMRKHLVFADERRGDVLRNHEAAVQTAVGGEKGRQAAGKRRVDEALDSPLGDVRQLCDRQCKCVERERERLAVKVSVRDENSLVDEHERIVGRGVQLDRNRRGDVVEQITARAVHLRGATQ